MSDEPSSVSVRTPPAKERGGLRRFTLAFLLIGITSFGRAPTFFPELVQRRRWMAADDYTEGFTLAKLLPGPTSMNMGAYFGFLVGGLPAGLYGVLLFTLPGALLMLGLSAVMFGAQLPYWVSSGLAGGAAAALGVLLFTGVQMADSARRARLWLCSMTAAFVANAIFDVSLPTVLLIVGLLSFAANLPRRPGVKS